jgi:superfamily II DNA/RNA helicase
VRQLFDIQSAGGDIGRHQHALVFTRTKHGANHLAEQLNKDGIRSAAIHGNKSQGATFGSS